MEKLSGWQADHIGASLSLRCERLHHQEAVARDRKGLGAATAGGGAVTCTSMPFIGGTTGE